MKKTLLLSTAVLMAATTATAQGSAHDAESTQVFMEAQHAAALAERPIAPAFLTPGAEVATHRQRQAQAEQASRRLQAQVARDEAQARAAQASSQMMRRPVATAPSLAPSTAHNVRPDGVAPRTDLSALRTRTMSPSASNLVKIAGTALDASPRLALAQVDTLLCTSYDWVSPDGSGYNIAYVNYDEYGRRSYIYNRWNGSQIYTYGTDDKGRWTWRYVQTDADNSGTWLPESYQERTIVDDKVTSITFSVAFTVDGETKLYRSRYYELEYGHDVDVYVSGINNQLANAGVTYMAGYNTDGTISYEQRWQWVEGMGSYVTTYYADNSSVQEAEIFDNHITTVYYYKNGDEMMPSWGSITYFGDCLGSIYIQYDGNGEIMGYSGAYDEYSTDADGYTVRITYYGEDFKEGVAVPRYKDVYSPDYANNVGYDQPFDKHLTSYTYDADAGEWVFTRSSVETCRPLDNGTVEVGTVETYSDGSTYSNTSIYIAERVVSKYGYEYWNLSRITYAADNSYTITRSYNDYEGTFGWTYEYYSAEGVLLRTIRQHYAPGNHVSLPSFYVQEAGSDQWLPLADYTTPTQTYSGGTTYTVYRMLDDGRVASYATYTTSPELNGGAEFMSWETTYTYGDNGDYSITSYSVYDDADLSKMTLVEKIQLTTLSDGTQSYSALQYSTAVLGEVVYSNREDVKDYVLKVYNYVDGEWIHVYTTCKNDYYTTDDGVSVSIMRTLSDDQTTALLYQRYESKNQTTVNADGTEKYEYIQVAYSWDTDQGDWRGDYRYEYTHYWTNDYAIRSSYELNPIYAYDDEYMAVVANEASDPNYYFERPYVWNNDTWQWDKGSYWVDGTVGIDGGVLTVATSTHYAYGTSISDYEETSKRTRDSELREATWEYESVTQWTDGDQTEYYSGHYSYDYTYNEQCGLLERSQYKKYDADGTVSDGGCYLYTYTPFTIHTMGIGEALADRETLTVAGRMATAPGCRIDVYNAAGMLVASGRDSLKLPAAPGVYIVKAGTATRKVALR